MFNSSLLIYDPFDETSKLIDIPGISHPGSTLTTEYHLDGIDYDTKSGQIFIAASSASAFTSVIVKGANGQIATNYSHANYTGPNRILIFDPVAERLVSDIGLETAQEEFYNLTGNLTNGFQDMAEIESTGDSYVIGTFGNSIVKISHGSQEARLWYAPSPSNYSKEYGFGGVFASGHKLVVSDTLSGGLVTFNTREKRPTATYVPLLGMPSDYRPANADGIYAPKRYGGKVALWSDDYNGTSVYGSTDNWSTAHYLGLISNDDPALLEGTMTTASFEVGDRVYVLTQVFQYSLPVEPKKNFPFYDITAQLDSIVQGSMMGI
jgi:hypothetical protein